MKYKQELVGAEEITQLVVDHKSTQTTLRYFDKGVFHVYSVGGKTGRKQLTELHSAKVRYGLCKLLQARKLSIGSAGDAISAVCGEDDEVLIALLSSGEDTSACINRLRAEVLDAAGF